MRRVGIISLLLSLSLFLVPSYAQDNTILDTAWHAEYFNNPYLAGEPNVTRFDERIGFDWGADAPVEGVPADNFSVRWGKGGHIPAGTYRFIVTSSLGFRLYIDDEVILDTWDGGAENITIGRDYFIPAGTHNIQLDFYSFSGDASIYLDWGLAPDGGVAPQSATIIDADTVTITANILNVRSEPRIANNVIERLARGQQFSQITRSENGRWVQLDLGNGISGWVSSAYVQVSSATVTTEGLHGQTLRSTARLFIRTSPDIASDTVGLLLNGEDATIIGRSEDANWWQVSLNGVDGWVNALFVVISPDVDVLDIPVTSG
ncbi:MAG: hypothetical protein Phog2KO_45590 [Phototrophicaceae bacterium]